jgi:hypothetical protein
MLLVGTETGSVYEFDLDNLLVRRAPSANSASELRKDNNWITLLSEPEFLIGHGMQLLLAPLGEGDCTLRITSHVTYIEES